VTLELDGYEGEYLAVPLCFNQLASTEPRRYIAAAHSTQPVLLQPAKLDHAELAAALAQVVSEHGERKSLGRHVFVTTWKDEAGSFVLVENASAREHSHVTLDCETSVGVLSSRGAPGLPSERAAPPASPESPSPSPPAGSGCEAPIAPHRSERCASLQSPLNARFRASPHPPPSSLARARTQALCCARTCSRRSPR
jgi:hypothetical protein